MTSKYKQLLQQANSGALPSTCISSQFAMPMNNSQGAVNLNYIQDKLMDITPKGGCRIVTFSNRHTAILVSQPSHNPIFPGFGVKKINFLDYKLSQYIPIHSKLIRDMALNLTEDGIILTGSMDKMIKMTNISNNVIVHSFTCPHPVWSCTYNLDNPVYFYAGLGNGHVLTFDKRRTDKYVEILNEGSHNFSPVCSLQYVQKSQDATFK